MMGERLLLLLGKTRYNAMNNYLNELGCSFEKMGYIVEYLDGREQDFFEKLYEYTYNNDYKAIISCNSILIGHDALVMKDSVYVCLMFDHPVYLFERLDLADERTIIIHCDLCGAQYITEYCPNVGSVGFVPLSGSYVSDIVPYKQRKYDIVFTGSCNNSDSIYAEKITAMSDNDRKMADELIGIMKNNPSLTMQDALQELLVSHGMELKGRQFHVMMLRLIGVEAYMRAWIREQIIRAIVDSGIKIHIFGGGWESFECEHPENIIILEGDGEVSLRAVADSKISLNVMPWFRGGFQERIASAMLCGAVALTDTSTYIEDNFINGEDIVVYYPNRLNELPDIIKYILGNLDKAERIALKGYEKAKAGHTWEHRAIEIMEVIDDTVKWLKDVNEMECNNVNEPKVSVIVPVYNSEKTLAACLGNLVNQTIDSIEIVIVDDCSSDSSRGIIRSCEMQYADRVKTVFLDRNLGPGGARNIGLLYATGRYIGFVDSDDIVDVSMYEKLYNEATRHDYDVVDTGFYNEESDIAKLYIGDDCIGEMNSYKRNKLILGGGGYICTKIFKRELFESMNMPFREKCILEDCDFMINIIASVKSIGTVREVLYIYKYYNDSASRKYKGKDYCRNISMVMTALYDRISAMSNYDEVREAVEAVILEFYSWGVNTCIATECNGRLIAGNTIISELKCIKDKVVSKGYDNRYLKSRIPDLDMEIMIKIDEVYQ